MFKDIEKLENVDLKNYSTMRTGGKAKLMLFPKNHIELISIIEECKKCNMKYFILGNGSNVLFDDNGFNGAIISLKHFNKIRVLKNNIANVGAGINLFILNQQLAKMGLSGLEWSYGVPASLGGFVVMNGGCFGHEIGEFVKEVCVLHNGKIKVLKKDEMNFSYRNSSLKDYIIISVKLSLKNDTTDAIEKRMQMYFKQKCDSQPCELPSLGSVFKRIISQEIIYPAKLIDNMGLKGVKINGAEVSRKHAGFIVNNGNATSADVLALIEFLEKSLADISVKPEREIIVLREDKYE